ncbi:hypothetical protein CLAFUW4_01115 [Fulvia fulva]|uniref:Uncharacterized protein n=1 Tax=Passalora fulva TaxID=5499 RepID=A0A9Q8P3E8_PASFU|nr:uncharacterized protein CLAFUR5_01120 [Fulvia fulva]KAK4636116.1 hypothetical protein CLAFUR4_01116 [Fulvia fulva]KAK4636586.1 hypothetical protein CLAFUR0_01117 [Fulvia fulva]UJO11863.1 hypothetical protein CLAFUR5_01120 [Fulvia fulva]WPV08718.1 hypothetical protein CLAFUW4_01115 [Fulvia fulva]WPV24381.1 hypothetical protein CLAFUW7_01120 [Fulvia fulva]
MSSQPATSVTASLGKLHISPTPKRATQAEPAECWEDEAGDSGSETEAEGTLTPVRPRTSDLPGAPPPTPSSPASTRERETSYPPVSSFGFDDAFVKTSCSSRSGTAGADGKRPDKTTSVASRLIAAGIGQKAPRRTKEEREYDQAMQIQEKKRRDKAREEEENKKREKERAQKAVWDD